MFPAACIPVKNKTRIDIVSELDQYKADTMFLYIEMLQMEKAEMLYQVQKYSDADLNWNNKNSRNSREIEDKSSRVEIADKVDKMAYCEEIYLEFPIWLGCCATYHQ